MAIHIPPANWRPRPYQLGVQADLERDMPNVLVICHRRFGKTELMLCDLKRRAYQKPANYFYLMPQTEQVRKTMWNDRGPSGQRRILEMFGDVLAGDPKEQEMSFEMVTQEKGAHSRIQFMGSDNHRSIRGGGAFGWYIDEWAFCDPEALSTIRPILVENKGFIRFLTTPYGKNHAYKMMQEFQGRPNWGVHYLPVSKTKALDADALQDVLLENISLYGPDVGQALYNQEYECAFDEIVPGAFYLDLLLKAEKEGRIGSLAWRPELPVYAAFDLGFSDPTSIWYVQVTEEGWVHVLDYDEYTLTSIPELIPLLRQKPWYYSALLLPHDGPHHELTSGTTSVQILEAAGFVVDVMPRTDDTAQIPSVRTLLPRVRFNHVPPVQRGLECLRHYHNKAKMDGGRTSWSPKPVHDWSSHGAKAMATLAYFAPDLKGGVKTPMRPKAKLFGGARSEYSGMGWMA